MFVFSKTTQDRIIEGVCYLFVLLFVYAAVSKLLDFENFQVQLGQSPLLSAYAGIVSWVVPLLELVIASILLVPRFRKIGLYAAFTLMTMFTTYIFIILNYSPFVPCSCGGVLEKMGWEEHLLFNICFTVLSVVGLFLILQDSISKKPNTFRLRAFTLKISIFFLGGIVLTTILFLLSEQEIHRNNAFLRRYPPHPVTTIKGINIQYNSYYIAGSANGRIFLGNTTAPAHVLSIDTTLTDIKPLDIEVDNSRKITFHAPRIKIKPPYFFLIDGTVPVIFRGNLSDWKAQLYWRGKNTFSQIEPVSDSQFVFSGLDITTGQNAIGSINTTRSNPVCTSSQLLQNHSDGVFGTDGMLHYNSELEKLVYVYYYKNKFLTADIELNLDYRGQTIDTLQQAEIKTTLQNGGRVRKLAEPPTMIQMQSCTSSRYLFSKSDRLGRYESEEMLEDASIIDVYDLEKRTYAFSFYLYDFKEEKIKSFRIYENLLIGLSEHYLVLYRLQPLHFDLPTKSNGYIKNTAVSGEDRKPVTE